MKLNTNSLCVCVIACVFLISGQMAGPIWAKLGTLIHLDPGNVLIKSKSPLACALLPGDGYYYYS